MFQTTPRIAALFALTFALVGTSLTASANHPAPQQLKWRFGMNVSLRFNGVEQGLMIQSVAPGSPAALAGLTPQTVILSANGQTFQNAQNDYQAVAMLQSFVEMNVPRAYCSTGLRTSVKLVVVRPCGTIATVICYPDFVQPIWNHGGIPTAR